jgi:LmbE family N-acetylglucosaminyl deacetylase
VVLWVDEPSAGVVEAGLVANKLHGVHVVRFRPKPVAGVADYRVKYRMADYYRLVALQESPFARTIYVDVDIMAVNCGFLEPLRMAPAFGLLFSIQERRFTLTRESTGDMDVGVDAGGEWLRSRLLQDAINFPSFNNGLIWYERGHAGARAFLDAAAAVTGVQPTRGQTLLVDVMLHNKPAEFVPFLLPLYFLDGFAVTIADMKCVPRAPNSPGGSACANLNMAIHAPTASLYVFVVFCLFGQCWFDHVGGGFRADPDFAPRVEHALAKIVETAEGHKKHEPTITAHLKALQAKLTPPGEQIPFSSSAGQLAGQPSELKQRVLALLQAQKSQNVPAGVPSTLLFGAHCDDELIWPLADMLQENRAAGYRVVIFHSTPPRQQETRSAMTELGVASLGFYTFTDCTVGPTSLSCPPLSPAMLGTMRQELTAQKWDRIVTHGHFGEYGHRQHKDMLRATVQLATELGLLDKLYVYKIRFLPQGTPPVEPVDVRRFEMLSRHYASRGASNIAIWGRQFRSELMPYKTADVAFLKAECVRGLGLFFRNLGECDEPAV